MTWSSPLCRAFCPPSPNTLWPPSPSRCPATRMPSAGEWAGGSKAPSQMALGAFLQLAARPHDSDPGPTLSPALEGAYELGRGEARQGRSIDALLSAYRVGARVAWRELSETAVDRGLPPLMIARFAELVFAFIDELSAASVSGHGDELASSDRERRRHLDRLGQDLLTGVPTEILRASAERAEWRPPDTLTAVLLPSAQTRGVASRFGQSTLELSGDLPGIESSESVVVLLIPDMHGPNRSRLLRELHDRRAVVGPSRPWTQAQSSYHRVLQARELHLAGDDIGTIDTDSHLVALVLGADREAADDLRHQVLAPLDHLRPNTAERLAETLRSWLLHQGQRDAVAADLIRPRPNRALSHDPTPRALRRTPQRPPDGPRTHRGPVHPDDGRITCRVMRFDAVNSREGNRR